MSNEKSLIRKEEEKRLLLKTPNFPFFASEIAEIVTKSEEKSRVFSSEKEKNLGHYFLPSISGLRKWFSWNKKRKKYF